MAKHCQLDRQLLLDVVPDPRRDTGVDRKGVVRRHPRDFPESGEGVDGPRRHPGRDVRELLPEQHGAVADLGVELTLLLGAGRVVGEQEHDEVRIEEHEDLLVNAAGPGRSGLGTTGAGRAR